MKQIMMKGKQRVKGTVLFTVVTVMMVMVVFLMSTLILTTSANRRSYYTYYKTQAQYAAQSALDCITNFAYSDGEFGNWVQNLPAGEDEFEIFINYEGSKMPLSDINAPNKSVRCTIKREKDNHIYDTITQKIHRQPQWKITATAVIGTGRNRTEAKKVTYLYANVQSPKTSEVKNKVDYVKYLYDDVTTIEETEEYIDDPGSPFTPIANAVYSLSPTGTTDNVVVLGPQYSGMTRIPKGRRQYGGDVPASANDSNYQKIQNNVASVGDGIFIDNVMMKVNTKFVFQKKDEGLMYYGNLDFANKGTYFDSRIDAGLLKDSWSYGAQNYLYVDGVISASGGGVSIGYGASADDGGNKAADKSSRPINVFAGGMNFNAINNGINICGDIYLYDPDVDSRWIGFKNSTILANFTAKAVGDGPAERASYSATHGNLVCNNKSITIGDNNSDNLTIDGNFLFTNPNGSVTINSKKLTVGGKAVFACKRSAVTGIGNITCGTIVCSDDPGYAAELQSLLDSGKYGSKTLADYKSAAKNNDYSLLPFNYRLDEVFDKYYRWDLAGNTNWQNDALVLESQACGHVWKTKNFTASVKTGTDNVTLKDLTIPQLGEYGVEDPYNDPRVSNQHTHPTTYENIFDFSGTVDKYETRTVTVPYTTPVKEGNVIMKAYEPIDSSKAAAEISKNSNLSISSFAEFKGKMKTGAPTITNANKASYGYTGSLSWAYPTGKEATAVDTTTNNVYYVNFDCEIDMAALNPNEILFIDPTQSSSRPLCVAIKGDITNKVILINNTAKYKGGQTSPSIDFIYGTADAKDADNKPVYFGREDVYLFLESGLKCEKALILTTGIAGGFIAAGKTIQNGNFDSLGGKGSPDLDLVSNPLYPGQTGYDSLSKVEKTKFMYVPNNIIFGETNATYTFTNGGMMAGAVMMPYSTVIQKTQAPSPKIKYREEHSSIAVDPGADRSLACVGSLVVGKFVGDNWSMVAYLGDGHRVGGKTTRKIEKHSIENVGDESNNTAEDPAFNTGQDIFNNDHMALN